jgi:hypothetical protein
MHARSTPVRRKPLVDPAACGVRLGVELRAAAEQEAYDCGMCLSHWIKKVVDEAVSKSKYRRGRSTGIAIKDPTRTDVNSGRNDFDSEFAREMGKLNDK